MDNRFGLVIPLASISAETVTPWATAIAERVSPDLTVTMSGGSVEVGGLEPGIVSC